MIRRCDEITIFPDLNLSLNDPDLSTSKCHWHTMAHYSTIQPRLWKQRMGTINNNWDPIFVALWIYFWVSGGWSCNAGNIWKVGLPQSDLPWSTPKLVNVEGLTIKNHKYLLGPPLSFFTHCYPTVSPWIFFGRISRTHGSRGVFQCCAGLLAGTGRQRIAILFSRVQAGISTWEMARSAEMCYL